MRSQVLFHRRLRFAFIFSLSIDNKNFVLSELIVLADLPPSYNYSIRRGHIREVFEVERKPPVGLESLHVLDVKFIDLRVFSAADQVNDIFLNIILFQIVLMVVKRNSVLLGQEPGLLWKLSLLEVVKKPPDLPLDIKNLNRVQNPMSGLSSEHEDKLFFSLKHL